MSLFYDSDLYILAIFIESTLFFTSVGRVLAAANHVAKDAWYSISEMVF